MNAPRTPVPPQPSFLELLAAAEDGRLVEHLTERMKELASTLRTLHAHQGGKPKGKLLLSIELKLDGGVFEMVGAVALKKPEPLRERSILYDTRDGGLSVNNPRQLGLPFAKDATPPAGDLRVM